MSGDYRIEYDNAQRLVEQYQTAADRISSLHSTMPSTIDGGEEATPLLLSILALFTADAHSLITALENTAELMNTSVDAYSGVEESANETIVEWTEDLDAER